MKHLTNSSPSNRVKFVTFFLCALVAVQNLSIDPVQAQVRPVNDVGALGLGRLLKRLNTTASVMMIGAHPDDEDSALLAYLARRENARTAYLSLTRGDGGQNIIGPELFESLGIIRTEELLQARRLDGAEQYFTRAFDYGFSKTLAEARQKWDERVILCDTVRAIRLFRPMVVISRFSGTAADGHGQHQFAGYISPLAIKAAADPVQCSGSGEPWHVSKFYSGQSFSATAPATLRLNTGEFDHLLGRTYFEIAMEGRSMHRSQGEGRIMFHGEQFSGLNLVIPDASPGTKETSVFDGINTSITGIAPMAASMGPHLNGIQASASSALRKFDPYKPEKIISDLASGAAASRNAIEAAGEPDAKFILARKCDEFAHAIRIAAGIQIDALSDRETVVPGEVLNSSVKVFFPRTAPIVVRSIRIGTPGGWLVDSAEPPKENTAAFNARESAASAAFFRITVPSSAQPTQPYWLADPRVGALYRWNGDDNQNLSFQPPVVTANVTLEIDGKEMSFSEPVRFRFAEATRGEVRRDLNVAPSISVDVDQALWVVSVSNAEQKRTLTVSVTNNSQSPVNGTAGLTINAAAEWKHTADTTNFTLVNKGEKKSIAFEVTIPAGTRAGTYNIFPNIMIGGSLVSGRMNVVAYPHIQTHRFYTRAETVVKVLELRAAPIRVGYVMGSGDDIPQAIRQMGINVTMLEEKDLSSGDLSKYDSIVVGIRASETRPDFAANNQRLLDYVKNGGNMIVQYQRPSFSGQKLLPFPATLGPRVVDENAKVTILQPAHTVFNFPNKITDADFSGWVQERNLYNFNIFDPAYLPLLESHDSGEAENKGGLVIANVGTGTYIYCSYSFFRQLPAGVGGAYRLFANLLSVPAATKK